MVVGAAGGVSDSGDKLNGLFEALPSGKGYLVKVKDTTTRLKPFTFTVDAVKKSGTELELSSLLGRGTLKFKNDFTLCELNFFSVITEVRATLQRDSPPPTAPKPAGGKGRKKAPPPIPPFIMVR